VTTVRAVWSGALSFGLVSIPVKLYPATEAKDVRFHLVDPETGSRVRYRRFVEREGDPDGFEERPLAPAEIPGPAPERAPDRPAADEEPSRAAPTPGPVPTTEVEVAFDSLSRAYEIEPGEQVVVTPEELAALRPPRSRTIEVEDFVELAAIDPVYFEKSYVLAPEYGGPADRPYVLLLRALERAGRVGIGRFVLRTKPHLVAIRPREGVLALETLYFGDEVRDVSRVAPPTLRIKARELELAQDLIGMLAAEWDPANYADTYREELLSMLSSKAATREPEEQEEPARPRTSQAEVLMDALRRSVEQAKERRRGSSEAV
jgi:DNA end-binding protein Ku